jgi:hypothetical protein
MSKSTPDKKPWFIERKTSSFQKEGKRRSTMTQDPTGILEPFRKYLTDEDQGVTRDDAE